MTKIDIFSGFLGAGKTTLIKKLIKEAYVGEKVVLIENEFGEIGIDGGFLQDAGIEITEMNSGCICCSLVGDFTAALAKVLTEYAPDRIIIEPSGVGKLSDVIRAVSNVGEGESVLNSFTTVADVSKCRMYMKNFGEFYNDQIAHASAIVLSHTGKAKQSKIEESVALIREHNPSAVIVTTDWDALDGKDILAAIERKDTLAAAIEELEHEHHHHAHHHHDEECHCHDHEHHDEECHCHDHEHHDEECHCHDHEHHDEHHHDHGEGCSCGCGGHGHHHADEVFASFGAETAKKFTEEEIRCALEEFDEAGEVGIILRAKGIVESTDGRWIHFDYVPDGIDIRYGTPAVIGRLCVIGSNINESKIKECFGI